MNLHRSIFRTVFIVGLALCASVAYAEQGESGKTNNAGKASQKKLPRSAFSRIIWTDLMPQDDLAALLNPPDYLADIQDGSAQDQLGGEFGVEGGSDAGEGLGFSPENDPYQNALHSTRVIEKMDGQAIQLPGFVVPIDFDDDQVITQFFLVPYFGACIHQPPPPPNQIIYVNYPKGVRVNALYDPFWVSGVLNTSIVENGIATSAYTLDMHYFEPYTEDE